nr:TIR domain-containing protein [Cytobacillus firmus]
MQYVDPYMSSKDISLGERWSNNIADNLEQSVFGLVFVTPSNINAPWINFEAGALSKTLNSKLIPIIYKADVTILNQGPLKQFQSAKHLDQDNVLELLRSINDSNTDGKLDQFRLEKAFEMWWKYLKESIDGVVGDEPSGDNAKEPSQKELLSVIYSKLTEQEKMISRIRNDNRETFSVPTGLIKDLIFSKDIFVNCVRNLEDGPYPEAYFKEIEEGIFKLNRAIDFLSQENHGKYKFSKRVEINSSASS